ncbi:hypothetical protein TNIN_327591 [Trichonephila inaurata madagascariensis]|uniref:sn-1-specific diacylglycerol lipase ABHD11 n=1 Tax=Trichonephila inaurata madagascariensis TaxID=2747483 RepID=A0A8X6I6R6_9ARAC|nr:hypothetical protein TNIN_327591 [Trichonephila inaurata madagascariensis]
MEFAKPGDTINSSRYLAILDRLRVAIKSKRPCRLTNGVILLHDNARPHVADVVETQLAKFKWETLQHPPYRSDLSPCDFHIFGKMKKHLKGTRFVSNDAVKDSVKDYLNQQPTEYYEMEITWLVYFVDFRNHGESPRSDEYTIDVLKGDVEEFLLDHKLPKVILVGHSLGGKVAMQLAVEKPDMVEKLIIEDSTPRNFISGGGKYMSLLMNMAYEIEKIMPTGVDRQTANQFFVDVALQFKSELKLSEETIRNYDADLLPIKWKGDTYAITINIAAVAKALMNDTLQQNLPGTYEGEVLLICGGKSQFKVGSDPLILKYFPKVKKIEFEDAGHFIHNSYPQQFLQEVVFFINHGPPCQAKY